MHGFPAQRWQTVSREMGTVDLAFSKGALMLTDTTYPAGRRRRIHRLVRLNPSELAWTNTHLDGPFRHSQYWYRIVADGSRRCHLEFYGSRLVTSRRSLVPGPRFNDWPLPKDAMIPACGTAGWPPHSSGTLRRDRGVPNSLGWDVFGEENVLRLEAELPVQRERRGVVPRRYRFATQ